MPTPLPLNTNAIWSAWGTPDFDRVLADQLQAHWRQIPLEKACESGGLPDAPQFHRFQATEQAPGTLTIKFAATFRETTCAGCGSTPSEQTRFAEFALTITPSECRIEYLRPHSEPEF